MNYVEEVKKISKKKKDKTNSLIRAEKKYQELRARGLIEKPELKIAMRGEVSNNHIRQTTNMY